MCLLVRLQLIILSYLVKCSVILPNPKGQRRSFSRGKLKTGNSRFQYRGEIHFPMQISMCWISLAVTKTLRKVSTSPLLSPNLHRLSNAGINSYFHLKNLPTPGIKSGIFRQLEHIKSTLIVRTGSLNTLPFFRFF